MKPKNVMLLGFINRAVEYLDNHMDEQPDSRLAELKNIDLASLRDELADNLDASLGTMQSTMATLLKAGNEAFDQFVEDSRSDKGIAGEFDKLFDIDLDGARRNKQEQLAKLLSFYNLDNDIDVDDKTVSPGILTDKKDIDPVVEDDEYLQEIMRNASNNYDTNETSENVAEPKNTKELDNIYTEILFNERKPEKKQEKVVEEPVKQEPEVKKESGQKYVSSLIQDLKKQMNKEGTTAKVDPAQYKDVYERISKLYPYISASFIRVVYDLKESLSKEYPIDKKIIILHRVQFKELDNLRKFVEIGLNHDYQINADEDKMIVDIFKEFINSDGKILANIYEIANQGCLLGGSYEGYNVIINE